MVWSADARPMATFPISASLWTTPQIPAARRWSVPLWAAGLWCPSLTTTRPLSPPPWCLASPTLCLSAPTQLSLDLACLQARLSPASLVAAVSSVFYFLFFLCFFRIFVECERVCVCVCVFVYVCVCVCEREREREREIYFSVLSDFVPFHSFPIPLPPSVFPSVCF